MRNNTRASVPQHRRAHATAAPTADTFAARRGAGMMLPPSAAVAHMKGLAAAAGGMLGWLPSPAPVPAGHAAGLAAHGGDAASASTEMIPLSILGVGLASIALVIGIGISIHQRLGLHMQLAVSAVRCARPRVPRLRVLHQACVQHVPAASTLPQTQPPILPHAGPSCSWPSWASCWCPCSRTGGGCSTSHKGHHARTRFKCQRRCLTASPAPTRHPPHGQ